MEDKIIPEVVQDPRKRHRTRLPDEAVLRIFQAIGSASMSWSDVDNADAFEVQRVHDIGLKLCNYVADLIEQERDDEAGYIEGSGTPLETILLPISRIVTKTLEGEKLDG